MVAPNAIIPKKKPTRDGSIWYWRMVILGENAPPAEKMKFSIETTMLMHRKVGLCRNRAFTESRRSLRDSFGGASFNFFFTWFRKETFLCRLEFMLKRGDQDIFQHTKHWDDSQLVSQIDLFPVNDAIWRNSTLLPGYPLMHCGFEFAKKSGIARCKFALIHDVCTNSEMYIAK